MSPDVTSLLTTLSNFGALGILVAFLIWKDVRSEAARTKVEEKDRSDRLQLEERQLAYNQARLEADKALAAALAALTGAIQSRG